MSEVCPHGYLGARGCALCARTTPDVIALIVRAAWAYWGERECTCQEDLDSLCWYHATDEERIAWTIDHVREAIDDDTASLAALAATPEEKPNV